MGVSIHAPHAGRDAMGFDGKGYGITFQSTRPMRGATSTSKVNGYDYVVSIHAPHAGRDRRLHRATDGTLLVSIHAPHAGRDVANETLARQNAFQSTRPMRGATKKHYLSMLSRLFQSTRPMRGATHTGKMVYKVNRFQSTRPMRGATKNPPPRGGGLVMFQSTRPMRGATLTVGGFASGSESFNPRAPCGARPYYLQYRHK